MKNMANVKNGILSGLVLALLALGVTGCMGADAIGATENELLEIDPGTVPLESVGADEEWEAAPAGCEDRLDGALAFKLASSTDHLVAAVDADGVIVCVDTIESVQEELEEEGFAEAAEQLVGRFLLAVALPGRDALTSWDPTPQPSTQFEAKSPGGGTGMASGDPSPQPSNQP